MKNQLVLWCAAALLAGCTVGSPDVADLEYHSKRGDIQATAELGRLELFYGVDGKVDYASASSHFEAASGDPVADYLLASMISDGKHPLGINSERANALFASAVPKLKASYEKNHGAWQAFCLGDAYLKGRGNLSPDRAKATELLEFAERRLCYPAAVELAAEAIGSTPEALRKKEARLKRAADRKLPEAMWLLANLKRRDDPETSLKYLRQAAVYSHPAALCDLALATSPVDLKLMTAAADLHYPPALLYMAEASPLTKEARLKTAVRYGDLTAMRLLGELYRENGDFVRAALLLRQTGAPAPADEEENMRLGRLLAEAALADASEPVGGIKLADMLENHYAMDALALVDADLEKQRNFLIANASEWNSRAYDLAYSLMAVNAGQRECAEYALRHFENAGGSPSAVEYLRAAVAKIDGEPRPFYDVALQRVITDEEFANDNFEVVEPPLEPLVIE